MDHLSHLVITDSHLIQQTIVLLPEVIDLQHHTTDMLLFSLVFLTQLGNHSIQLVNLLPFDLEFSIAFGHHFLNAG